MAFLRSKLYKLRISLGVEQKNMKFVGGGAYIFSKLFRSTPIFFRGKTIFDGSLQG